MTEVLEAPTSSERAAALAERLFGAGLGALDVLTVYLGERLGLYHCLAARPGATARQLAADAGIAERYATEWLEQQTVARFIDCADRSAPAAARQYSLPAGHDIVLLDPTSPAAMAPVALAVVGLASALPKVLDAYRTGDGLPFAAYGPDMRDGQAGLNRPAFTHLLADQWLRVAVPSLYERIERGESVRIADIACGAGWSSIALAGAGRGVRVDGFDLDDASIADARRNAINAGVADRVTFEVRDAASIMPGTYDLACVFEAVHDMSHPVEVLRSIAATLTTGGSVLVMDERVEDEFVDRDGPVHAFMYACSVLHCLPVGMADTDSVGTGTVMSAATMRDYATAAGFTTCEVLPIEHDLFRFYRLSTGV